MVVSLLGVGAAASIHFLARPHIFTLLLLSVSVWMVEADRRTASSRAGRIWWLVPLTVVWTSLHGGFLVLILTLGVAALGTAVEAWMGRRELVTAPCGTHGPDQSRLRPRRPLSILTDTNCTYT